MVMFDTLASRAKKSVLFAKLIVSTAQHGWLKNLNCSNFENDSLLSVEYPIDPRSRYGYGQPPHELLRELLDRNRQGYELEVRGMLEFEADFARIPFDDDGAPATAVWRNDWFGGLDAAALYALLCRTNPKRYLEIGSGYSTRFARRAVNDHRLQAQITSLDPHPRTDIDAISDRVVRSSLQDADLRTFEQLESGDILFFDGSHYCFTNSDVTVFFLEILPRLPGGILVHVHDIFLPYDYPPAWGTRFYSEQYILAALMLGGCRTFDVILPNQFVARDPELRTLLAPLLKRFVPGAATGYGSSFWLRTK